MTPQSKLVTKFAVISLAVTLLLSLIWEFYIEPQLFSTYGGGDIELPLIYHLGHVGAYVGFVGFAVLVLMVVASRLTRELDAKEKDLRKTHAERASFVSDIAHELRTPLAIMRAHLDTLEDRDTAKQMSEEDDRVSRIVEQIMAKSYIDSIEVTADDKVNLCEVVSSVASYMAPLVIKEGRTIEVLGGEEEVFVNANTFSLELALRNLVENAIKYSSRGTTISLEVLAQGHPNDSADFATVQVIDRGRGVPEGQRDLIFERFHRADRRGEGSGLGLSIVRRVADAHNGTIIVEDTPGGGATFSISIPKII